jgi:hypothetical protein
VSLFISLVVFAISLYLFILTNYKIRAIRENVLIEDVRKEMEALITEFNGAANRNIEMMEDAIARMQDMIRRANEREASLDERIARTGRPVVVERLVERKGRETPAVVSRTESAGSAVPAETAVTEETSAGIVSQESVRPQREKRKPKRLKPEEQALDGFLENAIAVNSLAEEELTLPLSLDETPSREESPATPSEVVETDPATGETRSERLKTLLREGRKKEDLIAMGYLENEINLMSFLVRK